MEGFSRQLHAIGMMLIRPCTPLMSLLPGTWAIVLLQEGQLYCRCSSAFNAATSSQLRLGGTVRASARAIARNRVSPVPISVFRRQPPRLASRYGMLQEEVVQLPINYDHHHLERQKEETAAVKTSPPARIN
jgi:hypothetical protein